MDYCTKCGYFAPIADRFTFTCAPCLEAWLDKIAAKHIAETAPLDEAA